MKQKHLLSLLQGGYTTINVIYLSDLSAVSLNEMDHFTDAARYALDNKLVPPKGKAPWDNRGPVPGMRPRTYTYKVSLDDKVQPGDTVVVDSPKCGLCLGKVVSVDAKPRIDMDADFDYKWIVQKVDRTAYDKRVEAELVFADTLQEVERVKQRDELLKSMQDNLPAGSPARALFDEAIKTASGTLVIGRNDA